ncbi:MAG: PqqD family protein [Treponema sp.]|jgi:hypothetical protein|nr:PqqD family protein [Treponema sp.]
MTAFSYLADHILIRKELKLRIEGNIGIVCNTRDFRVHYLNETATMIFCLIDGKRSVAEIAQCFLETVDVDRDVFERDLVEMIRDFQWKKLIALKLNL